jgi:hypothetical protein
MGCTPSSSSPIARERPRSTSSSKKKAKGVDLVDVHPDDSEKMRDDMLQRHDSEADITLQLFAEREALKALSGHRIEKKLSFEDLLEALSSHDFENLEDHDYCFALQKEHYNQRLRDDIKNRRKRWTVKPSSLSSVPIHVFCLMFVVLFLFFVSSFFQLYNNLEAITDFELTIIGVYLMSFLRALNNKNSAFTPRTFVEILDGSPFSSPTSSPHRKSMNLETVTNTATNSGKNAVSNINSTAQSMYLPTTATALAALRPNHLNHKIEDHIRDLSVVNIAPVTHYQVSHVTLYDYELPPGLITINEAKSLIELFRRGGRLVGRSVHKILRLAYKHLKSLPNLVHMTVTEEDKLIVVGDIHGER